MTARERWINTLLFKHVDKIPFAPGGPRESTLKRWYRDGLPQDKHYTQVLADILQFNIHGNAHSLPLKSDLSPYFEEKVLSHENGHYIVQNYRGEIVEISDEYDVTYLRHAKDFVTRKWHKFPVETRADFELMKQRYNAEDMTRYEKVADAANKAISTDNATILTVSGIFWQLRDWCGFEGLCELMITDPEFVSDMADFYKTYLDRVLELMIAAGAVPDHIVINEDMAYKSHSMISPAMTEQFIMPAYDLWIKRLRAAGTSIIDVDSDGYINTLIPLWIKHDVNCNSPMEVAAYNDIVLYSSLYGKNMAYRGGIDKRCIAAGGKILIDEMNRIETAAILGGYIPGCDHGVPPDISWQNFVEYCKILAKITGWI